MVLYVPRLQHAVCLSVWVRCASMTEALDKSTLLLQEKACFSIVLICNYCSDAKWTRFLFILELGQHFCTRSTSLKQSVPFEIGKVENILKYNNFYIHTVHQLPRAPPHSAHCSNASEVFAPMVGMKNTTNTRYNWWQLSCVWAHGVPAPGDRKHHKRWRCKGLV